MKRERNYDNVVATQHGLLNTVTGEIEPYPPLPTAEQLERKMWRNRILATIAIAAAILGAMYIASPDAKADTTTYLTALRNAGYTGSDAGWVSRGYEICRQQAAGAPTESIVRRIVLTTGSGIYSADAYEIIGIVNAYLCKGSYGTTNT